MFHLQPLKSLYIIYFVTKTLFISFPYWTLRAILISSSRPSKSWTLRRYLYTKVVRELLEIIPMLQILFFKRSVTIPDGTFKNCKFVWVPAVEKENIQEPVKTFAQRAGVVPEKVSGFWYFKKGYYTGNIADAESQEKVLYCLHGGAYFHGSACPDDVYGRIPKGILKYSKLVTRAFSLDYRLSSTAPIQPRNPFPAALLDAIAGYNYILSLDFKPQNVILVGDSAGGNLALALVRYILEAKPDGLQVPGSMLLLSPWTDVTFSRNGPETSFRVNHQYDIFRPGSKYTIYGQRAFLGKTWTMDEAGLNPYISPCSSRIEPKPGEYNDYPKTFVVAGQVELIRDDSLVIADYLKRDNPQPGHINLHCIPNEMHDILIFDFAQPQYTENMKRVTRWIDDL